MRLLALCVTAMFCIVACHTEPTEPVASERAQEAWMRNERVIQRVIDGDAELDEEFMGAWRFFRDTIGIVIRLDGDYSGLTLTADSREDFDLIRNWYESNSHRLYWDEHERAVRVNAPPGPAGAIWWHHESILLDLIAGESVPEWQRNDTRKFFLTLTGIDVFAGSRGSKNGLVPAAGPQKVLTQLRLWYRENGDNLVVNQSSGKLELGEENSL